MDVSPVRFMLSCVVLGVIIGLAHYELREWFRETDARQRTTYADCANYDTLYVHDAHWNQQQRTTRVRKIAPSPLCATPVEDTTR